MRIENKINRALFIKRLNRFEAMVSLEGAEVLVHVPNTGRCRELLLEGATVLLEKREGKHRKTGYELIMVYRQEHLVSIDSQLPNKLAEEGIRNGVVKELQDCSFIKREAVFGDSRFDLYLEWEDQKAFVEVKGVTLEVNGAARFPDAPTERGTKHIHELIKAKQQGYRACVLFVIQLDFANFFEPNTGTDPKFGEALKAARQAGVEIYAYRCRLNENEVAICEAIEVRL